MPRPKRSRRICRVPEHVSFSPDHDLEKELTPEERAWEEGLYAGMSLWLENAARSCAKTITVREGDPDTERVVLTLEEFETIRLVDYEKQTHSQCAAQMDISRTTVTEIYEVARQKIADCIVNGKRLVIEGGDYRICNGAASYCCRKICDPDYSAAGTDTGRRDGD